VIDKIQVFDDMSDQAKFSGFDDGNRVKTLNITTKKDKKKGMFGKAVAGIGSKDDYGDTRYEESFNFTKMNGDQQLTLWDRLITLTNKTSPTTISAVAVVVRAAVAAEETSAVVAVVAVSEPFYLVDLTTVMYGALRSMHMAVMYLTSHVQIQINSSRTQTILGADTSNYTNASSTSQSKSENHRFSFNFEDRIDSVNSLIFRPNFALQSTNPVSASSTETMVEKMTVMVPHRSINL
jgi:hypothetical protein